MPLISLPRWSVRAVLAAAVVTAVVLVSGCTTAGQHESVTADPPTLVPLPATELVPAGTPTASAEPATPQPSAPLDPSFPAAPTPAPDPAPPLVSSQAPRTVTEVALDLGIDGLIETIAADPEAAGERGPDLLRELRRVQDKPDPKRRDRFLTRLDAWLDQGGVNTEVAEAARAVVLQAVTAEGGQGGSADQGGGADDDGDDDD